ncbi:hypothetical protein HMN09_00356600 [Mycena chlorophos]|uniref:Uncharacterized protein n=1 Tax=Mycena chlorophos TaxID=658473 RepID=A0A8H6WN61_MYCCL|nr:hypothetical protein HMN09_00356600 [Mycena chlorophos]
MVLGPRMRLVLPYVNFILTSAALTFQTTVLYPRQQQLAEAVREQGQVLKRQGEMLRELANLELRKQRISVPDPVARTLGMLGMA